MNAFNERFNRTVEEDFVDYEVRISWPRIYDRSTTACWTTSTAIMANDHTEESTTAHPVKCLLNAGLIYPICGGLIQASNRPGRNNSGGFCCIIPKVPPRRFRSV